MPLALPEPFEGNLPRSPLALVACQVRYSDINGQVTGAAVAALRQGLDAAGFAYPRTDQVQLQNLSIDLGSGATNRESAGKAWRLQSSDSRWIVTVGPEAVTLETTRYDTWERNFRARFAAIVEALSAIFAPRAETRLGLRYVDVISDPPVRDMQEWSAWINPALLGPIAHPRIGSGVTVIQQQFSLSLDDDVRATIRLGVYPDPARDGALTCLIDTDVFRESLLPYSADGVIAATERLHDWNLRLFQQMITPEMLVHLRGELQHA